MSLGVADELPVGPLHDPCRDPSIPLGYLIQSDLLGNWLPYGHIYLSITFFRS